MKSLALVILFYSMSVVACDEDVLGPNLGPTVGPEFRGLLIEIVSPSTVESDSADIQIRLTNVGTEPFTMTDPQFDVYVLTPQGQLVWNWLDDKVIIGGGDTVIEPGNTYVLDIEWDLQSNDDDDVGSGDYSIFAVFYFPEPPALVSQTHSLVIRD